MEESIDAQKKECRTCIEYNEWVLAEYQSLLTESGREDAEAFIAAYKPLPEGWSPHQLSLGGLEQKKKKIANR
jgi:hypothetical protein